ncbi:protein of unknown function [Candidatus Nitrosocosmicus franklandus]|uniref:Uncharacterized protein n=1 Tax=Candidatus Nitrosocosmicus franklandianus TaxID=1798806 RepID=A0A484IBL1_9ARCH|nr:protein of unknown function [Candidatus Nitrosocosmicus franklandus]
MEYWLPQVVNWALKLFNLNPTIKKIDMPVSILIHSYLLLRSNILLCGKYQYQLLFCYGVIESVFIIK